MKRFILCTMSMAALAIATAQTTPGSNSSNNKNNSGQKSTTTKQTTTTSDTKISTQSNTGFRSDTTPSTRTTRAQARILQLKLIERAETLPVPVQRAFLILPL